MENAKHIGGIWALAVTLGVGMAVVSTPAVALASPDSGDGSSPGGSSPSSSSSNSGSASSDGASANTAASATQGPANRQRRPLNVRGPMRNFGGQRTTTSTTGSASTPATLDTPGKDPLQRGRPASRREPRAVTKPTAGPAASPNSVDAIRVVPAVRPSFASTTPSAAAAPVAPAKAASMSSTTAPVVMAPTPAATVTAPAPADPVSRLVSTLIDADLSPFADSAPTAPVESPAEWTLLAFARREFEQALTRSTTFTPPPSRITNGLVTGSGGVTSAAPTTATDPLFDSNTHKFGLFSITSAALPGEKPENNFVALVFQTAIVDFVLTSGADPDNNLGELLGFGDTLEDVGVGVEGRTVGTLITPLGNFSITIPFEDPISELFILLVRLGI